LCIAAGQGLRLPLVWNCSGYEDMETVLSFISEQISPRTYVSIHLRPLLLPKILLKKFDLKPALLCLPPDAVGGRPRENGG